ncbi:MAG TPA: nucleotide disphospho-sugar-binding domain-containing protein [Solirubrobacterales bacterium]|nr:nucleotide disphospho-sugar-binding domain-containing protein [Solirubrobacterales bacterium]
MLEELLRRGHEVVLRTLTREVEAMRSLGFDAAPISSEIEGLAMDDWRARTATGAQLRAMRRIRARAHQGYRDLSRAVAATRPDALIVDVLAAGALSAAMSQERPWCCYRPFPLPPSRIALQLLGVGRALSAAPLQVYMSAQPFEYPRRDRPPNVVMVGPCCWEPAGELPVEFAEVENPLVLVTTSTEFQDDGRLVAAALEALDGEPFHVVATGPAASGHRLTGNATALTFAPHTPILRRSACAITHGGMGVTQKALALGVPVVAVPFGRDQFEVARRVEACGGGIRLPARRLNPKRLREKVRASLACRPGAERVARAFAAAGGAAAAAEAVEERLLG